MPGPLEGLNVVEMEGLGPCPLAGQFLADLGAAVIVIVRKAGPPDPTDIVNRGKRSVALDIKSDKGLEAARRLIARADILIEGFRPGVMERLGLGPEAVMEGNPGLIYGRMTGWGQDGPLSQTAGHDINYLGVTGVLHAIGRRDAPPPPPLNIGADYAGGTMFLLLGVLSALWERGRSGRGQVVDAAMVDGAAALMSLFHSFIAKGRWRNEREANLLDGGAPFYRSYETKDGRFLSVGALEPQFHAEFLRIAGLPAAHQDTQMAEAAWPERHAAYEAVFKSRTRAEWTALFAGSDACVAPVMDWEEAPDHPQMKARGALQAHGGVMQAAPAPRFGRTPAGELADPPAPGADTAAILREIGLDEG
ncbi:CaiB/BaiF CoA-transferase family protein [Pikeienuella sp. HZG-20]|uniref:CaiB/BaiF CoA transferase family protein n=1 Tax=Paludibacillus litoralis TaxID=3133267 RepID=UPI0030EECB87